MLAIPGSIEGGAGRETNCFSYSAELPEVFGPPLWHVLHALAAIYPDSPDAGKVLACTAFVESLPALLPCGECSEHLAQVLSRTDVLRACSSGAELSTMWCRLHNQVNERLGKPQMDCTQARDHYADVPVCNPTVSLLRV